MHAVRFFKNAREYLTPVLAESAFLEKGMLTPDEVHSSTLVFKGQYIFALIRASS